MKHNVIAKQFTAPMAVNTSTYATVKLALRGVTDLSGMGKLQSELCQTAVGGRAAVEVNGVILVAQRTSSESADLITGWKVGHESDDISKNASALLEMLYKVVFARGVSAMDIRKEIA